ncbi:aminotransferase class IV, partial [Desulfobulbus sp. F4]|nr:aminotransferase class IV [Desulfobulbus sp. F4]
CLVGLADSARYFHFSCDLEEVRARLEQAVQLSNERLQVRLLLHRDGRLEISSVSLPEESPPAELPRVIFSQERVDSSDPHRFHKTTRRELYNQERALAMQHGYYEVLFTNTAGQVTEGAVFNIFLHNKGENILLTPPIKCGSLAGTYRRMLLEQGHAVERILTLEDILAGNDVYLSNSVRGFIRVQPENDQQNMIAGTDIVGVDRKRRIPI